MSFLDEMRLVVAAMFELTREDWTLDLIVSFFVLHYTVILILTCSIMHYHLHFNILISMPN